MATLPLLNSLAKSSRQQNKATADSDMRRPSVCVAQVDTESGDAWFGNQEDLPWGPLSQNSGYNRLELQFRRLKNKPQGMAIRPQARIGWPEERPRPWATLTRFAGGNGWTTSAMP